MCVFRNGQKGGEGGLFMMMIIIIIIMMKGKIREMMLFIGT
jgi:hypothetical protein